jgi:hypothetical protein
MFPLLPDQIEKEKNSAKVNVKDVLIGMRRFRMGLIQTHEQLRFSFLAIIDGTKMLHPLPNGSPAEPDEQVRQRKLTVSEESGTNNNRAVDERERDRQERKRKTEDTIRRIRDKSKQMEQWSKLKSQMLKFGLIGAALILGAGFLYGYFVSEPAAPSPSLPLRQSLSQNLSH